MLKVTREEELTRCLSFIQQNLNSGNPQAQHAALVALNENLETQDLRFKQLVEQSLAILVSSLQEENFDLGKISSLILRRLSPFHSTVIRNTAFLLVPLLQSLRTSPFEISINCCFAIHNLIVSFEDGRTADWIPHFKDILEGLIFASERGNNDLRCSSYEVMNTLLSCAPKNLDSDIERIVEKILNLLWEYLNRNNGQLNTQEGNQILSSLCSSLHYAIPRLNEAVVFKYSDMAMTIVGNILSIPNLQPSVVEEALLVVGSIVRSLKDNFRKYLTASLTFLMPCLNPSSPSPVCCIAVDVASDIFSALGPWCLSVSDSIFDAMTQLLKDPGVDRYVKPGVFIFFGEMAKAIGQNFQKYQYVMSNALPMACQVVQSPSPDPDDDSWQDYFSSLTESIFLCYSGILRSRKDPPLIYEFFPVMYRVSIDSSRSQDVSLALINLIRDLSVVFGSHLKEDLKSFVRFVDECLQCDDQKLKDVAIHVKEVLITFL